MKAQPVAMQTPAEARMAQPTDPAPIKLEALSKALEYHRSSGMPTPETLVETARVFEEYLAGAAPKAPAK